MSPHPEPHTPGPSKPPRTRRDRIRDWMIALFVLAVLTALAAALLQAERLIDCAGVLAVADVVLAFAYGCSGGTQDDR